MSLPLMQHHTQQLLSFRDRPTGKPQRVDDVICWRRLEGRPCLDAHQRATAASVDAVILPIPPARQACRTPPAPLQHCSGSTDVHADRSKADHVAEIMAACHALADSLRTAGLRVVVDSELRRMTRGQAFHRWSQSGVPLRLEVGCHEVSHACACIAVHAAFLRHPSVAATFTHFASSTSSGTTTSPSIFSQALHPILPSPKLRNVPLETAPLACATLLHAIRSSCMTDSSCMTESSKCESHTHSSPGSDSGEASLAGCARTSHSEQLLHTLDVACMLASWRLHDGPDARCGKLHLWEQRMEGQHGCVRAQVQGAEERTPTATAADSCSTDARCAGAPPLSRDLGRASRSSRASVPPRVCVPHLRHCVGSAKASGPCPCGQGHVSLAELRQEVERQWCAAHGRQHVVVAGCEEGRHATDGGSRGGQNADHQERGAQPTGLHDGCGAQQQHQPHTPSHHSTFHWLGCPAGSEATQRTSSSSNTTTRSLLATGFPPHARASQVQASLVRVFQPFQGRVSMSRAQSGGSHGWARVTVPAQHASAALCLDGTLVQMPHPLPSCHLRVSEACGRVDALFPSVHPAAKRAQLRLDPVAAYSVSDTATADAMTEALGVLASAVAALLPAQPRPCQLRQQHQNHNHNHHRQQQQQQQQCASPDPATTTTTAHEHPLHALRHSTQCTDPDPLPWSVTDGTACAGGNTAALARRFGGRLVAVEVDEDRALDLLHNLQLLGVAAPESWSGKTKTEGGSDRHLHPQPHPQPYPQQQQQQHNQLHHHVHHQQPFTTSSPSQQQQQQQQGDRMYHQEPCTSSSPFQHDHHRQQQQQQQQQERPVHVLCCDYTQHALLLPPSDIVFLDPPWGGPNYVASPNHVDSSSQPCAAAAATVAGMGTGGPADAESDDGSLHSEQIATTGTLCKEGESQPHQQQRQQHQHHEHKHPQQQHHHHHQHHQHHHHQQQQQHLRLGDTSLAVLCGQLLGSAKARIVGLKLPAAAANSQHTQALVQEAADVARAVVGSQLPAAAANRQHTQALVQEAADVAVATHSAQRISAGGSHVCSSCDGAAVCDDVVHAGCGIDGSSGEDGAQTQAAGSTHACDNSSMPRVWLWACQFRFGRSLLLCMVLLHGSPASEPAPRADGKPARHSEAAACEGEGLHILSRQGVPREAGEALRSALKAWAGAARDESVSVPPYQILGFS